MMRRRIVLFILGSLVLIVPAAAFSPFATITAQTDAAPCGYVDGFDFPVPDIDLEYSDFGIYRARFGGFHTGIDVAFEQLGSPVRAAARGRVTFSDTEGWDTEKGVVVVQHTFPDGTLVNTLYGHMEELNGYTFPLMDQCVERGEIIGAVGHPSRGLPHLHYEVRTRYRHEGGPGYTDINPLELGWLHPLDFTFLARVWVLPAYRQHFLLTESPTQPPLALPDDSYVFAYSAHLEGRNATGQSNWRFDTLGSVTGMIVLLDGRVLVATSDDQVLVLNNGSYSALWDIPKTPITPPILLGDAVLFMMADHTLMAFTSEGDLLWETGTLNAGMVRWSTSGERLAIATRNNELWIVDDAGTTLFQATYSDLPIPFAAGEGEFVLLSDTTISRIDRASNVIPLLDTGRTFAPEAQLIGDESGTLYLYTGEGRSLYAYLPNGTLQWIAYMPGSHLRAPHLALGGGRLLYALTTDGQLLAFSTEDGRLVAQTALYHGGIDGSASARWLRVDADDNVRFSSGYLSIVTLDGLKLLPDETAN